MARRKQKTIIAFEALTVEGGLIAPAMLAKIALQQAAEQKDADYRIKKGLVARDEIARFYRIGQAIFREFAEAGTPSATKTAAFVEALLTDVFEFGAIARPGARSLDGQFFPVTLEALSGRIPVVIVPPSDDLDRVSDHLPHEDRRRSAASAIQDWLNANEGALWGFCCNGSRLRLVRENPSLTRPAYIEADLAHIFESDGFADFAALWLLIHASRFGAVSAPVADCALERWREAGAKEGLAARDRLRDGVEAALLALGNGFLVENPDLRDRVGNGELPLQDFFGQLLRLVYRLIFLLVAEERDLLHAPDTSPEAKRLYAGGYSLASLREAAVRRVAWDRHNDRWEGLKIVFLALARGEPLLGLPALGGLFLPELTPDLDASRLPNRALMEAIYRLAWIKDDSSLAPVNWRDMETEELGSVYESLLELTPRIADDARVFAFAEGEEARGHARKTTGSYYTPDSLVQTLLDSALDPVLDRVEREADDPTQALLSVSVIDPACGSGHFLLAAARRIAGRVARARAGGVAGMREFHHALRDVARCCINGVDRNPMAVELTKVALWIETVEPGKPLGFLDASIKCGDALLGLFDLDALRKGIPDDAYKPLAGDDRETARHFLVRNRAEKVGQGSLDATHGGGALPPPPPLAEASKALRALPEDSTEQIAEKKRRFDAAEHDPRAWNWRIGADLYVAAFLTPKTGGVPANRNVVAIPTTGHVWQALSGQQVYGPLVGRAQDLAGVASAFHWPLEFPDVMGSGGFDVVLGNPPWERIKLQEQEFFASREPEIAVAPNAAARGRLIEKLKKAAPGSRDRALYEEFESTKRTAEASSVFVRVDADSGGRFPLTGCGDVNTYALFAELFAKLQSARGHAGLIVPTGIATDATTAPFFAALIDGKRLVSLLDFENREAIFPAVHRSYKFSLLTLGHAVREARFSFFNTDATQLADPARQFTLSAENIARINPNTKTAPVFRSKADAELTAKIYARVKVLIDESKAADGNPWGATFHTRIWHMSEDSEWFRTAEQLQAAGFVRFGADWLQAEGVTPQQRTLDLLGGRNAVSLDLQGGGAKPLERYVPLYEAKMIHQFDHRWATYDGTDSRDVDETEKRDPGFEPIPRYWVPEREVAARLAAKNWARRWLIGWRDICRSTDERSLIADVIPSVASNDKFLLIFPDAMPEQIVALLGCFNSLVTDFVARQKIGGTSFKLYLFKQIPILRPECFSSADLAFITPRVLELTYTSHAMATFARDLGFNGPPFAWDEDRRALLRAELDAFYARAYGLTRDELRYILDPAEIRGPDYPSETFRVLKNNETRKYGEYRTARLVLDAWDRMERGEFAESAPPITVSGAQAAPVSSFDWKDVPDGSWATPAGGNIRDKTLAQIAAVLKSLPEPISVDLARRAALYALEPRLLTPHLDDAQGAEWLRLVGPEATPRAGVVTLGMGGATGWGAAIRQLVATGALIIDSASQTWGPGAGLDDYFTDSWPRRATFALDAARKIMAGDSAALLTTDEETGLTALVA